MVLKPGNEKSCETIMVVDDGKAEMEREIFEVTLFSSAQIVKVDPKARKAVVTIVDKKGNRGNLLSDYTV